MTQKITYIAYDGTEFEDVFDCINHEMICDICKGTLEMYIGDKEVCNDDMIRERTYNTVTKVVVNSEYDLELIHRLKDDCGYLSYGDITSAGTWIFKEPDEFPGYFIKVKD